MQVFRNSHSLDLNDTKGNKAPNMVKFKDLCSKEDTKKWYYASLGERRFKKRGNIWEFKFPDFTETIKTEETSIVKTERAKVHSVKDRNGRCRGIVQN